MSRFDMSDFELRVIDRLLPNKQRGLARVDDRRVLNGIFTVFALGAHGVIPNPIWALYNCLQSI